MAAARSVQALCALADLGDPGARGLRVSDGEGLPLRLVVVRRGQGVFGYVNSCPHNHIPLDFRPDDFFDLDHRHIQCATHGALFLIDSGVCVEGPCKGDRLRPIALSVRDGIVFGEIP
ncbi:(2Fe-2S)-binding protein [Rhodospirillum rubrum]|uniref:Rieske (2Fe-2S) protein n=1 Tax=Rhodospirillum rubrum TaxID=1085 RepID=UPI0019063922|nr:Rieske 2Fe-2S domain-containing protein [Rhodospirillum rubrum]MBK1664218.1 (2Fe-2S)-binding protein [Rhodospirillum rubrum]MBK1676444.1 (2Fe-2S)-binding protein [Rhodospirillum rubrum]